MADLDRDDLPKTVELRLAETKKREEREDIILKLMEKVEPRIPQTSKTETIFTAMELAIAYVDLLEEMEDELADMAVGNLEVGLDAGD